MSMFDMNGMIAPDKLSDELFENESASNCLIPMGLTSENVCEKYGLNRKKLDQFAYESHMKANRAHQLGFLSKEIAPITVTRTDKDGNESEVLVFKDDGIRPTTTPKKLARLKPAFKKDGMTTAGNSSQVTDGAAAVILMTRRLANKLGMLWLSNSKDSRCLGSFCRTQLWECRLKLWASARPTQFPRRSKSRTCASIRFLCIRSMRHLRLNAPTRETF